MKLVETVRRVQEVGSNQWGLVTTQQMRQLGVTPLDLKRASEAEIIVPIIHGIYKDAGSPPDDLESLRAYWLRTRPSKTAYERWGESDPVVITGATAAWLHGIGDLHPEPYEFSASQRIQSRSKEVRFRRRLIGSQDISQVHGLPVSSIERTLRDLHKDGLEPSLFQHCFSDAMRKEELDGARLVKIFELDTPVQR